MRIRCFSFRLLLKTDDASIVPLALQGLFDTSLLILIHTSKTRVVNTLPRFLMLHNVYLVLAPQLQP